MPSYQIIASYNAEGVKGVLKNGGTARADAVGSAVKAVGGTVQSFYFAFGEADVYVVADFPDNTTAAALALAVAASGLVGIKTIPLLTPAEIDAAAKLQVGYQAPGK